MLHRVLSVPSEWPRGESPGHGVHGIPHHLRQVESLDEAYAPMNVGCAVLTARGLLASPFERALALRLGALHVGGDDRSIRSASLRRAAESMS